MGLKFKKYLIAPVLMCGLLTIAPASQAGGMPDGFNLPSHPLTDQGVRNDASNLLQNLGIQPSGTVKENNEVWCVFNDWQARDNRANFEGTFNNGRYSTGTPFGGKWYCTMKRR